ncbi:death domain-containing ATP nucleosidase-like isoform X3 [Montipora capricornis]|uniref:death domain-containing ATP nucleosidase-like isoform X3 n=1 Tax=Montipora capricornis TaxID=246305 RepID=UPI0035F109CF
MGDPPQLSVIIPKEGEISTDGLEFSENFFIDFLLLTVQQCEFLSCYHHLLKPKQYYSKRTGYVYVGKIGDETEQEKLTIGLMKCSMGSGVGGSAVTVQNAVTTLKPKGVFCVGFCGGMNAKKAKLGDVVVSAKLISYAPRKVTEGGIELRGTIVPLGKKLNDLLRDADHGWKPPLQNLEEAGKAVNGTMLSGPVLVNNKNERAKLLEEYPNAIAIEMEGEGVYTAAHDLDIEWAVVKGISDYADGTKDSTKDWQCYASVMSASLVAHVLRKPRIFKDWLRYDGGSSPDENPASPPKKARMDSVKDGQVSVEDMEELAVQLGDEWIKLGRRLNVRHSVLSDLNRNAQLYPDLSEKANEMLRKWKTREGDSATYEVLYDELCHDHVGRKDLAQKICCH